jgi:hypothetical protein
MYSNHDTDYECVFIFSFNLIVQLICFTQQGLPLPLFSSFHMFDPNICFLPHIWNWKIEMQITPGMYSNHDTYYECVFVCSFNLIVQLICFTQIFVSIVLPRICILIMTQFACYMFLCTMMMWLWVFTKKLEYLGPNPGKLVGVMSPPPLPCIFLISFVSPKHLFPSRDMELNDWDTYNP